MPQYNFSYYKIYFLFLCILISSIGNTQDTMKSTTYPELVQLYKDWRTFENPPKLEGAPDYTWETFKKRHSTFEDLRLRLDTIDRTDWEVHQKVDWMILWAEMNGYEFNLRILKPWERDPAYYKCLWTYRSDVPAHEGPTNHGTTELWTYSFPLSDEEKDRLISDLSIIPSFYEQAKMNLIGNARDLWITGIRDIRRQSYVLKGILEEEGVSDHVDLVVAIQFALAATDDLVLWLEKESSKKNGPSGIGKENYTWYLQKVHLVPLTWEDEVMILKRELARAWSSLKLEEHRNRKLPQLKQATTQAEYEQLAERSAVSLMKFLEEQDIVTVKDYFDPALREHLGAFVPEETRNFFWIGAHYDPRPL